MPKKPQPIKKKRQQNVKKQPQEEKPSPNLLESSSYKRSPILYELKTKEIESGFLVTRVFIISIQIFLVLLIGLNYLLNLNINKIEQEAIAASKSIGQYRSVLEQTVHVTRKIDLYKKVKNERVLMAPYVSFSLTRLPNRVELKKISFEERVASMEIETATALDMALLISNYFDGDLVEEITIDGAELNARERKFDIKLTVRYR